MAHFAEVKNTDNKVLRVVVISNDDVDANGGDYHSDAEVFVQNLLGNTSVTGGTYWKQCSYNENHRDRFPGIDSTWDADNDRFSPPCPYPNWVFDSDNNKWKAPFECVISAEDAAEDGKYHRPEWNTSRNTWVCLNLADATTTIGEQEYSVLKHGLLIPDDWDGDKYYWDNDTDNWVKF
jgi:hypothetical protein|tara:strand:- start:20 stop:556 length:537 start_codon:yes stop_codon:yes gene_type:complete